MSDQQQLSPSTRVTLEDLFRIKRAERPPADFWTDFERDLRAKQLAAIVEKRPWWRSRRAFSISRWSIPLGAAAALTFTFAVVGPSYRPSQSVLKTVRIEAAPSPNQVPPSVVAVADNSTPAPEISQLLPALPVVAVVVPQEQVEKPKDEVTPKDTSIRGQLASVTEQIAGIGLEGDLDREQEGATRFASAVQSEFTGDLSSFFKHAVANLDSRMRSERVSSIEPLAQVPTPRDARRARLLAFTSSVDTHSPQYSDSSNVIRSRDRIANHLSEEALYDSIRRLDIKNGRVSIQF